MFDTNYWQRYDSSTWCPRSGRHTCSASCELLPLCFSSSTEHRNCSVTRRDSRKIRPRIARI